MRCRERGRELQIEEGREGEKDILTSNAAVVTPIRATCCSAR